MQIAHPCYDKKAHFEVGRIHLPVAPFCNVKCNYCERKIGSIDKRPGVSKCILSPEQALDRLEKVVQLDPAIKVVGIAGPGDPLANETTFLTLELIQKKFDDLHFCLSTNGLALPESVDRLWELGVRFLTVTLNAVDPIIGAKIYSFVRVNDSVYKGEEGAEILLKRQLLGIEKAVAKGFKVKINSVFVPTINDEHLVKVAQIVKEYDVFLMNIMPLLPSGKFKHLPKPDPKQVEAIRQECAKLVPQWSLCKQCRADAIGIPGRECGSQSRGLACSGGLNLKSQQEKNQQVAHCITC